MNSGDSEKSVKGESGAAMRREPVRLDFAPFNALGVPVWQVANSRHRPHAAMVDNTILFIVRTGYEEPDSLLLLSALRSPLDK